MTRRRDSLLPAEVSRPIGERGVRAYRWRAFRTPPDLEAVLAVRTRPWILCLWEPLTTKIPGPALVQPHCCYIRTVIFYARPFQELPPKRYFQRHDRDGRRLAQPILREGAVGSFATYAVVEHSLSFDDHVEFDGEHWHVHGGTVRWCRPGWWIQQWARRMPDRNCDTCRAYEAAA